MDVGDTFIHKAGTGHLYFIVARSDANELVFFNATTLRANVDTTCVIEGGEHPAITHKSVVLYSRGDLIPPAAQAQMAAEPQNYPPNAPASSSLLLRIQRGALRSPQTPIKLQKIVEKQIGLSGHKP